MTTLLIAAVAVAGAMVELERRHLITTAPRLRRFVKIGLHVIEFLCVALCMFVLWVGFMAGKGKTPNGTFDWEAFAVVLALTGFAPVALGAAAWVIGRAIPSDEERP